MRVLAPTRKVELHSLAIVHLCLDSVWARREALWRLRGTMYSSFGLERLNSSSVNDLQDHILHPHTTAKHCMYCAHARPRANDTCLMCASAVDMSHLASLGLAILLCAAAGSLSCLPGLSRVHALRSCACVHCHSRLVRSLLSLTSEAEHDTLLPGGWELALG